MEELSAPLVVSIGTTHPRNVAGLGLDVRIATEYRVSHAMAVAGVSAQDERGVHALFALPSEALRAQLRSIALESAAAVRVGALAGELNAEIVAEACADRAPTAPIFDPVMRASAGGSLYTGDALRAVRRFLERAAPIVTPNTEEAQELTGIAIRGVDDMIAAGQLFLEHGASAAIVKGGHLPGEPVDVLVTAAGTQAFGGERIAKKTRGTGCMLAMALACELALGRDLADAVKGARAYVRANIARS